MPHITQASDPGLAPALDIPQDTSFQALWTIQSNYQKSPLTSVSVSDGGLLVASASLDSNMLFMDAHTGALVAVLDFKSRFHVTKTCWCTDLILYAGCSDGLLYMIVITLEKKSIAMRPILGPFSAPVTALALDSARNLLAVGCGGDTYIFSGSTHEAATWRLINHISSPAAGRCGFVTTLGFWGNAFEGHWLFIGHAKAGFCIWYGPDNYRRVPYGLDGYATSISDAAISNDGTFIAIVTLDHSVIVYPLHRTGPIIDRQQVLHNQEQAGYRPIVPIALIADKLILQGSASGSVPIFDIRSGPLTPIHNDSTQVVRALVTFENKVIIGLSGTAGQASQISCYLDQSTSTSTSALSVHLNHDNPLFEVIIDNLEESSGGLVPAISKIGNRLLSYIILFTRLFLRLVSILRCRRTWILM
ncbi:hypothetical protein FRC07_009599, partial [Ceratobasidium sp. 392]